MSDSELQEAFTGYIDLWHDAILRRFGTPQDFRELIEETDEEPLDWFTESERLELDKRYEAVIRLLVANGIPEDRARGVLERAFLEAIGGPQGDDADVDIEIQLREAAVTLIGKTAGAETLSDVERLVGRSIVELLAEETGIDPAKVQEFMDS